MSSCCSRAIWVLIFAIALIPFANRSIRCGDNFCIQQNSQLVPVETHERHIFATKAATTLSGSMKHLVSVRSISATRTRNQSNQFRLPIFSFVADSNLRLPLGIVHFSCYDTSALLGSRVPANAMSSNPTISYPSRFSSIADSNTVVFAIKEYAEEATLLASAMFVRSVSLDANCNTEISALDGNATASIVFVGTAKASSVFVGTAKASSVSVGTAKASSVSDGNATASGVIADLTLAKDGDREYAHCYVSSRFETMAICTHLTKSFTKTNFEVSYATDARDLNKFEPAIKSAFDTMHLRN
jgi:hypothetical protein